LAREPLTDGLDCPSSATLCARIKGHIRRADHEAVLEPGAGTGVISRALLGSGLPPAQLIVDEIVPAMANHLRLALPGATVIEGDARSLPDLIPPLWHGRIGNVIRGVPLVLLPAPEQRRFIAAIEAATPGRGFLH